MHHEQRRHGRPQRMRCLKRACGHERQCNRTGECEGIGEIVAFPAPQSDKLVHRIGIRNHALKRGLHNRRKRREHRADHETEHHVPGRKNAGRDDDDREWQQLGHHRHIREHRRHESGRESECDGNGERQVGALSHRRAEQRDHQHCADRNSNRNQSHGDTTARIREQRVDGADAGEQGQCGPADGKACCDRNADADAEDGRSRDIERRRSARCCLHSS